MMTNNQTNQNRGTLEYLIERLPELRLRSNDETMNNRFSFQYICNLLVIYRGYFQVIATTQESIAAKTGIPIKIIQDATARVTSAGYYESLRPILINVPLNNDGGYSDIALVMLWALYDVRLSELHQSAHKYSFLFSPCYEENVDPNIILNAVYDGVINKNIMWGLLQRFGRRVLFVVEFLSKYSTTTGHLIFHRSALTTDYRVIMACRNLITGTVSTRPSLLPLFYCDTAAMAQTHLSRMWIAINAATNVASINVILKEICGLCVNGSPMFGKSIKLLQSTNVDNYINVSRMSVEKFKEIIYLVYDSNRNIHHTFDTLIKLICQLEVEGSLGVYIRSGPRTYKVVCLYGYDIAYRRASLVLDELLSNRVKQLSGSIDFLISVTSTDPFDMRFPFSSDYIGNPAQIMAFQTISL